MRVLVLAALLCLVAFSATARDYAAHFPDMDADGDDSVSKSEFMNFFSQHPHARQTFATADADGDGSLSHPEWHRFKRVHGFGHE